MKITVKLNRNANIDGLMFFKANQNSVVLLIFTVEGIATSIINNVSAIANTPSQNASSLEL